jgi:uncharacterized protein with GYD domain
MNRDGDAWERTKWHDTEGIGDIPPRTGGRKEERSSMPTYVSLVNWTDQGIRNIRDTLDRADRSAEVAEKHGASLQQIYWTVGPYDIVTVVEAPDDEAATAYLLEIGSAGNVRTTTLRAYDREEMSGILERLG